MQPNFGSRRLRLVADTTVSDPVCAGFAALGGRLRGLVPVARAVRGGLRRLVPVARTVRGGLRGLVPVARTVGRCLGAFDSHKRKDGDESEGANQCLGQHPPNLKPCPELHKCHSDSTLGERRSHPLRVHTPKTQNLRVTVAESQ